MPDTLLDTFEEIILEESFDFTIPCESMYCSKSLGKDSHEADWAIIFSCGDPSFWCQDRLDLYNEMAAGGVLPYCSKCGAAPMTVVTLTPVHHPPK